MRAFDQILLENKLLLQEANILHKGGIIGTEQLELIEKQLPAYPDQNVFIRIGLFVLGIFLYSSCCGLFAFVTTVGGNANFAWTCFVYAAFGFSGLELMIQKRNYYANGLDDAFLYCAEFSLIAAVGFMIGDFEQITPVFLFAAIIGTLCSIRYADRFSALIACSGMTSFVVSVTLQMGDFVRSLLPFILMCVAVVLYFTYKKIKATLNYKNIYSNCLNIVYVFSLALFYLGGNYLVVREASSALMNRYVAPGSDISFAFLFYAFTFITPLAYIYFSLVKKDRILLWTGLACAAFSIFTIRYYYHLLPTEVALLLGGFILFVASYYFMNKLKGKTSGLTFEQDRFIETDSLSNLEVVALLQRYAVKAESSDSEGANPGGGEFGGGGSGNNY